MVFDVVAAEKLVETALELLQWANTSGAWKEGRHKKKQPASVTQRRPDSLDEREQILASLMMTKRRFLFGTKVVP